jgi:glycosyltransferase involved in cell wall biosynthesis
LRPADPIAEPLTASTTPLPRVLYAIVLKPGEKFSSGEEQMALLASAFEAHGSHFHPLFITDPATSSTIEFDQRGIPATCLGLMPFNLRGLRDLVRVIDEHRIDIIHWNFTNYIFNAYVWGLSIVRPRLRHWYTDHASKFSYMAPAPTGLRRFAKSLLLRRYERTICVSAYIEQYHRAQRLTDRLVTCLHFINTARFTPNPAMRAAIRQREGVEDAQVLLYVGNLIWEKGVDLVIDAMADLPASTRLWVVGAGVAADGLRARAQERGLADRVRFLGQQFEVQPFMQAADVLVCPSRWGEAAGFVNMEAQACGLPVVAARIGGIPEYVVDGRTGLLVKPDDVDDLNSKLATILENDRLRARLSAAARAHAAEHFSPAAGLPPMLDAYRGIRHTARHTSDSRPAGLVEDRLAG